MIALQEDEKLRAPLQLLCTLFIAISQGRDYRGIQPDLFVTRSGRRVRFGRVENERGLSSGCYHRIETGTVEHVGGNGGGKRGLCAPSFKARAA
jgi:hypothetical protein